MPQKRPIKEQAIDFAEGIKRQIENGVASKFLAATKGKLPASMRAEIISEALFPMSEDSVYKHDQRKKKQEV